MKKILYMLISMCIIFILILTNAFGIKGDLYILFRQFPKEAILKNTGDYNELETEKFIIRYNTNDTELVELVSRASEEYYDEICKKYNYYPEGKSIVILYDDPKELLENTNLSKSKPPMGVYYASTIQILSPRVWCPPGEDMEYLFMNEGPMVHEFTHLVIDDITKGNCPLWFTEGLALYSEYIFTKYEWGREIEEEEIYTIDQLKDDFGKLDQYLAYTQSFRVVKHMVETYEFESIKEILKRLEDGDSFEKAFKKVTNDDISKLNI